MINTTTLTEAVKALYTATPTMSVKDILENLKINQTHLKADYRKVYNTFKRISGTSNKNFKIIEASDLDKCSIIFDLTASPTATVKGVLFKRGQHCK